MNRRDRLINCLGLFALFNLKHIIEFRLNHIPMQHLITVQVLALPVLISTIFYYLGPAVEWLKKEREELD